VYDGAHVKGSKSKLPARLQPPGGPCFVASAVSSHTKLYIRRLRQHIKSRSTRRSSGLVLADIRLQKLDRIALTNPDFNHYLHYSAHSARIWEPCDGHAGSMSMDTEPIHSSHS